MEPCKARSTPKACACIGTGEPIEVVVRFLRSRRDDELFHFHCVGRMGAQVYKRKRYKGLKVGMLFAKLIVTSVWGTIKIVRDQTERGSRHRWWLVLCSTANFKTATPPVTAHGLAEIHRPRNVEIQTGSPQQTNVLIGSRKLN